MADEVNVTEMLKARGFDSIEKVLETLDSTKADLTKHKTRASELDDLKNRLQAFENEKAERENAAKTEAEKLADQVKALQVERDSAKAEAGAAARLALLERGLGKHLGIVPDKFRPVAEKYLRTVLPGMDWKDDETLGTAIGEQIADFTKDAPPEYKPVVSGGDAGKAAKTVPDPPSGETRTGFSFVNAITGKK